MDRIKYTAVSRPQRAAERYYSRLAPWYDWLAASEQASIEEGIQILNPQPGEAILDIGSGTGRGLLAMIKKQNLEVAVGLDLSSGMCQVANKKIKKINRTHAIDLIQGNALKIPLQSKTIDGIFCSFTLELFDTPDIPLVLMEFQRILKPTGRLLVISLSKDNPLPWMGQIYEQLHLVFPTWIDCRPIPVIHILKDAGFLIRKEHYRKMWGLPINISLSGI